MRSLRISSGGGGSSSFGPSDPTFASEYAHEFLMSKCEPCIRHQTPLCFIKATILTGGVQVPELSNVWMCPTSARKSMLPVEWGCPACRTYYIHRGIVLPQIGLLGERLDDMEHSTSSPVSWCFTCPSTVPIADVIKSMCMVLHCLLPDLVEVRAVT